jgi:hypothetical protein
VCAGIAPVGFVVTWATPLKFFPLLLLAFISYLATFVFAVRTLEHLRARRLAGDHSGTVRLRRVIAWLIIVVYGGFPIILYLVFLVALTHSHFTF